MNKIKVGFIFIAVMLFSITVFGVPKKITMEDQKLGNLKLYMTRNEVLKIMKIKPISVKTSKEKNTKGEPVEENLDFKDGTSIFLMDGETFSITVKSLKYPTPRGLKVGDLIPKLKQLYGEPQYKEKDGVWTYSYEHGEYNAMYIRFKQEKVSEIKITLTM